MCREYVGIFFLRVGAALVKRSVNVPIQVGNILSVSQSVSQSGESEWFVARNGLPATFLPPHNTVLVVLFHGLDSFRKQVSTGVIGVS